MSLCWSKSLDAAQSIEIRSDSGAQKCVCKNRQIQTAICTFNVVNCSLAIFLNCWIYLEEAQSQSEGLQTWNGNNSKEISHSDSKLGNSFEAECNPGVGSV